MNATLLTALAWLAAPAHAGGTPKVIRYDSYREDGEFTFGAFFPDPEDGLGKYNCMAQVYSFDDEDFPLVPTELRMFWAGEGAGAASEVLLKIYFYHYESYAADIWTMAAGQYRLLDQEVVLLDGISLEGTWVELNLAENGFDFDGDPDISGNQPITYGSIVASVCYENEQTMPAIAFDNDGYKPEPVPEDDEDIVADHDTSQFRSMIYWNGLWSNLYDYLMNTFEFAEGGDLIMRLVVDTQWEEDEEDEDPEEGVIAGLSLRSVSPESQQAGDTKTMLITGVGINDGAEAFVGGVALTGMEVLPLSIIEDSGEVTEGQTLSGTTSSALEVGLHSVLVRNPDGEQSMLEDAFRVTDGSGSGGDSWDGGGTADGAGGSSDGWEDDDDDDDDDDSKSICGYNKHRPNGLGWIWLLVPLLISRRSDSAQG